MATVENEQVERIKRERRDAYRHMIFEMTEGAEFPDDVVRERTALAGFSLSDLSRHTQLVRTRYRYAVEDRARIVELPAEAGTHETRVGELKKELGRLDREYRSAIAPLAMEHNEAQDAARTLRRQIQDLSMNITLGLRRSLPAGWQGELDRLAREHGDIVSHLPSLQKQRGQLEPQLKNLTALEYRVQNSATPQAAKAALREARAAHKAYDSLTLRIREIQDDAQQAQAKLDAHSALQFDGKTVDFLTESETQAARDRKKAQLHDYREDVGVGAAGVIGP